MSNLLAPLQRTISRTLPQRRASLAVGDDIFDFSSHELPPRLTGPHTGWLRFLASGQECVYDVGTGHGVDALTLRKHMHPEARLVLFEPNRDTMAIALCNLELNFSPADEYVFPFICAAGDHTDRQTITLDDACKVSKTAPTFIKIDVEGAEIAVLARSEALAARWRPFFMVKLYGRAVPLEEVARLALAWCQITGYSCWQLVGGQPLTEPAEVTGLGHCYVLLLPPGAGYAEQLRAIPPS